MRISILQRAGEFERFAPTAFDSQLGKEVPLTVAGQFDDRATLVSAHVSADGSEVELTFDVPHSGVAAELIRQESPGEFSLRPPASLYTVQPIAETFPVVRDDPHLNISTFTVKDGRRRD